MKVLNIIMIILIVAAVALLVGCTVPVEAQDIYFLPGDKEDSRDTWLSRSQICSLSDPGDVDMIGSPWDKLATELHSSEKEYIIVLSEGNLDQVTGLSSEEKNEQLLINFLTTQADPFRTRGSSPMFLLDNEEKSEFLAFS